MPQGKTQHVRIPGVAVSHETIVERRRPAAEQVPDPDRHARGKCRTGHIVAGKRVEENIRAESLQHGGVGDDLLAVDDAVEEFAGPHQRQLAPGEMQLDVRPMAPDRARQRQHHDGVANGIRIGEHHSAWRLHLRLPRSVPGAAFDRRSQAIACARPDEYSALPGCAPQRRPAP